MEGILLKDPNLKPDKKVLEKALGGSYKAYEELMNLISAPDYSLQPEWRYYNDGKAWLCKVIHRKKTIFWLSAWEGGYFRTVFYFTEKTGAGVESLDIDESIKKSFKAHKPVGKLLPLAVEVTSGKQLPGLLKIISYKMKL
jgi:hypothetical protein